MQCRAAVRRTVARLVRGECHSRPQVRAHQQGIDHPGGGSGIGEPLVPPRRHAREGKRGATEHPRQRRDLVDVGGRVAAHARRVRSVYTVYLGPRDQLAVRSSDSQVARDGLESVAGQLARREIVAPHGVEGVDQLASRGDESHAATTVGAARGTAACRALPQARRAPHRATERKRYAEDARTPIEKGAGRSRADCDSR